MLGQVKANPVFFRRLAGPILDKELRVLSRRMPTYAVRVGYLLLLSVVVTVSWFVYIRPASAQVVAASRMSDVAAYVVAMITSFQFIVAQILAVVLPANAIHEEVRRGTMDALFASGISGALVILLKVMQAYRQRRRLQKTLLVVGKSAVKQPEPVHA